LTDIVQGIEGRTGASQAPPPPQAFTAADEEVIAELKKRIERDIRAKIAPEEPSPIVTPAEAGVQEPTYPEVAPSARPQGWACLGQALDSRLRGNDE
jgi:hypothetical protein